MTCDSLSKRQEEIIAAHRKRSRAEKRRKARCKQGKKQVVQPRSAGLVSSIYSRTGRPVDNLARTVVGLQRRRCK